MNINRTSATQLQTEVEQRIGLYSLGSIAKYIIDDIGFRLPTIRRINFGINFRYKLKNGISFMVRPFKYDRYIIDEIFLEKAYFPSPDFWIKDNEVIVDIGAHIGVFTVFAAKRAKCLVYSYEPRPDNYELLKENIRLNGIQNCVRAIQSAVGGVSGNLKFSMDTVGLGSLDDVKGNKIIVRTITLKDLLDTNHIAKVDFLKIDVEGEELRMLLNLPKEYLSRISRISMESHTKTITSKLTDYLSNNGFSVRTLKLPKSDMSMIYAKNDQA